MYRLAPLLAVTAACAAPAAPITSPPNPSITAAAAPPAACVDLAPLADPAPANAAGIQRLDHQAGPTLAPTVGVPAGLVVAAPGRLTRTPLVARQAGGDRPVDAHVTVLGDRLDLRTLGLARVEPAGGQLAIEPLPGAVGAVIRLHDAENDEGDGVLVAYGTSGAAHAARALAHLATLATPTPDEDGTPRHRQLEAVLAHDVDRDGVRELVVRSRLRGAYDEAELDVLWADGRSARLADGTIDGMQLRGWAIGPTTDGRTPWFATATCCDSIDTRWVLLAGRQFGPVTVATGEAGSAACAEDLVTAPRVRLVPPAR